MPKGTQFQKKTLENGVTLVMERHPNVLGVSVGVWVRVGSAFESPNLNGMSHFVEHMVFKGTQSRTPLDIVSGIEAIGGDLNAFTDREYTCYHATVLKDDIDTALEILADILIYPTFPAKEIEREKKVLLQEMAMVEETPDEWITSLFLKSVWQGESLGMPVLGARKTVKAFTRRQLESFFQQYYRAENIVISVAGNFEFSDIFSKCESYFQFPPLQKTLNLPSMTPRYRSRRRSWEVDTDQLHIMLGFDGGGLKSQWRFEALLMSYYLAGGMSSRLFQEIREKAAIAYSVECDHLAYAESGLFTFYVAVHPRSLRRALEILSREVVALRDEVLSSDALDAVRGQLRGSILLSSDQIESRQESIGRNEIIFGEYFPVEETIRAIEKVTPEGLQAFAQETFTRSKEACVTLGKKKYKSQELSLFA